MISGLFSYMKGVDYTPVHSISNQAEKKIKYTTHETKAVTPIVNTTLMESQSLRNETANTTQFGS